MQFTPGGESLLGVLYFGTVLGEFLSMLPSQLELPSECGRKRTVSADEVIDRIDEAFFTMLQALNSSAGRLYLHPYSLVTRPFIFRCWFSILAKEPKACPTSEMLRRMVEALLWVYTLEEKGYRNVVIRRCIRPKTSLKHSSWREIGTQLEVNGKTAQRWHELAINQIVNKLNLDVG